MTPRRAYTITQACEALAIPRRSFFHLRQSGQLPMLVELKPRIGRVVRYKAEPIDRYLAGEWGQPRSFSSHRRIA
jgi:hypothetical protein